jgi:hypothetical protein
VRASTATQHITVPVLLSVGQDDKLQCDETNGLTCSTPTAVVAREAPYYGAKACLSASVVADAGHSIDFHRHAPDAYDAVNRWVDAYTSIGGHRKDANGCLSSTAGSGPQG